MTEKKYTWIKVANSEAAFNWQQNNMTVIETGSRKICIAKFRNTIFAFADKCPHSGGILNDGYIDMSGNVVCPVHHYKFNIKNGLNSSGEGYKLKTYPVTIKPEGIFIGIEEILG
ncbi:MAG: Rieske 2Fe-2S domain-containing protein [Bacteroidetes bacterium]|nr:Rieske 2Fe-2S domain-containing protein [Bacteroidota bacterium]MBS1936108.1 Rieske 2Fe-2S domain-containing protein [Bacteroidota bacterium]